jgi:hypothetical protein
MAYDKAVKAFAVEWIDQSEAYGEERFRGAGPSRRSRSCTRQRTGVSWRLRTTPSSAPTANLEDGG